MSGDKIIAGLTEALSYVSSSSNIQDNRSSIYRHPGRGSSTHRPWTKDEVEKLLFLRREGVPFKTIKEELNRNKDQIQGKISRLKARDIWVPDQSVHERFRRFYSEEKYIEIRKLYEKGLTHGQIAIKVGLRRAQVNGMLRLMIDAQILPRRGKLR